jgi:hypothetical protein
MPHMDPALFFGPEDFESAEERKFRVLRAQRICGACEVRAECLATAHENGERHGIWGGIDMGRTRRGPSSGDQTHCKRRHLLDEANTYVYEGQRHCKTCRRENSREQRKS